MKCNYYANSERFTVESEEEEPPDVYMWSIVKIGLLLALAMILLPLLIKSGAFAVIPLLVVYWFFAHKSKKNRMKHQSLQQGKNPRRILVEELSDGNFAAYDYETLERLTFHSYKNANNARLHMKVLYPAAHITIR